jgi:hypothetical protein
VLGDHSKLGQRDRQDLRRFVRQLNIRCGKREDGRPDRRGGQGVTGAGLQMQARVR